MKICLHYSDEGQSVLIKKSHNVEHKHDDGEHKARGINDDTRVAIKHLYAMGTRTAQLIIYSLRDKQILDEIIYIKVPTKFT